jgi:hypothetical protein
MRLPPDSWREHLRAAAKNLIVQNSRAKKFLSLANANFDHSQCSAGTKFEHCQSHLLTLGIQC